MSTSSSVTSMTSFVPSRAAFLSACRARYFDIGSTIRKYTTAAVITKLSVAPSTEPHRISTPLLTEPSAATWHGPFRQVL